MKQYLTLLWISIILIIAILSESPISVESANTKGFSALNAMPHIETMAKEFHFMGTPENEEVKQYILDEFEKLDIETEVFTGYCETVFRTRYKRMAQTENIIARIPGSNSTKAVVVAGHYDSILSAPGAADDVHAVACMLEIAKLLKTEDHPNDIIFLITDGEEMGLLGAKAFVESKPVDHIGVLLNYEARGNSGAGIFFEWSEGNSWLVQQLKKAARRPVTNSMAFEIYKRLPNDSDFTHFKAAGIKGMNHAFIDGFSYYHNPADTPENINLRSVQHTGENMYRLVRHFAQLDLTDIPSEKDASFFNFLGQLVIYPQIISQLLVGLAIVLFLLYLINMIRKGLSLKKLFVAFMVLISSLILILAINTGISFLLFKIYPQYDLFYTGQFYNHKWYIITAVSISVFIAWYTLRYYRKHEMLEESKAAMITFLVVLCILISYTLPTASYLITWPLVAICLAIIAQSKMEKSFVKTSTKYMLSLIPLAIWGPVVITLFLAFSIKLLAVPAIVAFLLVIATCIMFPELWEGRTIKDISASAFVASIVIAHIFSYPSEKKPLPSNLHYLYNSNTEKSYWVTDDSKPNEGNLQLLEGYSYQAIDSPYPIYRNAVETDIAPVHSIPEIIRDSIDSTRVYILSKDLAFKSSIYISNPSNINSMTINDHSAIKEGEQEKDFVADIYGFGQDSLNLKIIKRNPELKDSIAIRTMMKGMPEDQELEKQILRTGEYSSIVQYIYF